MNINLDQLIAFYVVAKERSFSEASRKLFISTPAVCMKLGALEKQFGVKLLTIKKKSLFDKDRFSFAPGCGSIVSGCT